MFDKSSRPVTKWDTLIAVIVGVMGLIGLIIGYSYPDNPIFGKMRGFFIFMLITYIVFRPLEKWLGIDKKIKDEVERKLEEANTSKKD